MTQNGLVLSLLEQVLCFNCLIGSDIINVVVMGEHLGMIVIFSRLLYFTTAFCNLSKYLLLFLVLQPLHNWS